MPSDRAREYADGKLGEDRRRATIPSQRVNWRWIGSTSLFAGEVLKQIQAARIEAFEAGAAAEREACAAHVEEHDFPVPIEAFQGGFRALGAAICIEIARAIRARGSDGGQS